MNFYSVVVEAASAAGDWLSSGLSSVEACSVELSEPDAEVGGAVEAVVVGVEGAGEVWGAAEAVFGCERHKKYK